MDLGMYQNLMILMMSHFKHIDQYSANIGD